LMFFFKPISSRASNNFHIFWSLWASNKTLMHLSRRFNRSIVPRASLGKRLLRSPSYTHIVPIV
jgi:hypothetical protein